MAKTKKPKIPTPPSVKCWGLMSQAHVVTASLGVNRWNYMIYLQKCMSFVPYVPWENSFWFKACRTFAWIKSYYIIVSFAAACAGVTQCSPPPCAYFKPFAEYSQSRCSFHFLAKNCARGVHQSSCSYYFARWWHSFMISHYISLLTTSYPANNTN